MYWRALNSTEPSGSCRSFEASLHCERRQFSSCATDWLVLLLSRFSGVTTLANQLHFHFSLQKARQYSGPDSILESKK
jgi:hypothetical protein